GPGDDAADGGAGRGPQRLGERVGDQHVRGREEAGGCRRERGTRGRELDALAGHRGEGEGVDRSVSVASCRLSVVSCGCEKKKAGGLATAGPFSLTTNNQQLTTSSRAHRACRGR